MKTIIFIRKIRIFSILSMMLMLIFTSSCSSGPEPIRYGEEACSFCKMTIVDTKFGAEIVTTKGKVFKFDALECMFGFENKKYIDARDIKTHYVVDASRPAELMEAAKAQYLQTENLPSPMGGNISAFATTEVIEKMHSEFSGKMLDWNNVKVIFKN